MRKSIKRINMLHVSPLFDDSLGHELPGTDNTGDRVVKLCYWALYAFAAFVAIAVALAN